MHTVQWGQKRETGCRERYITSDYAPFRKAQSCRESTHVIQSKQYTLHLVLFFLLTKSTYQDEEINDLKCVTFKAFAYFVHFIATLKLHYHNLLWKILVFEYLSAV